MTYMFYEENEYYFVITSTCIYKILSVKRGICTIAMLTTVFSLTIFCERLRYLTHERVKKCTTLKPINLKS